MSHWKPSRLHDTKEPPIVQRSLLCKHSDVWWTTCTIPEEEDIERHPDGIALLADPDGLQDAWVSQLTTDQLVFKHACLLNAQQKEKEIISCSKTEFVHAYDPQWRHNVKWKNLPSCYLAWCSEQKKGCTCNKRNARIAYQILNLIIILFVLIPIIQADLSIFSTSSSRDCWNLLLTVGAWYFLVTVLLFLIWPPLCWPVTSVWTRKRFDTIWTHTNTKSRHFFCNYCWDILELLWSKQHGSVLLQLSPYSCSE